MSDPIFTATSTTSFGLYKISEFLSPSFVDIDKDGDLDVFAGNYAGNLLFFKNTGTSTSPAFIDAVTNPFGLTTVSTATYHFASPTFVDIDKDGDLDMFAGSWDGNISFFKNNGTASNPIFAATTTNPFGLSYSGSYSTPSFIDIDNDGDLDVFVGSYNLGTQFFRNTGTASNPVFSAPVANRFGLTPVSYDAPTFADVDGDGDFDAFVGCSDGNSYFFRNTGTASNPVFSAVSANPFGLSNVGLFSKPNFIDIDKDGDLDAFIGNRDGNLVFFANSDILSITGTAKADKLTGTDAKEIIYGLDGNDILNGGAGVDTLIGGKGNDTYLIDNKADLVKETSTLATEIDTVKSSVSYILPANVENLTLTGKTAINGTGNDLDNILIGNTAANTLKGGLGNDTYYVDNAGDVVIETSTLGKEIDKVNSSISYTLTDNVEKLTLTGIAQINGTGNALNNTLIGNNTANTLNGDVGNDVLNGSRGKDVLTGGAGKDVFKFTSLLNAKTNLDTITDFNPKDDSIQLDNKFFAQLITPGTLDTAHFVSGAIAVDTDDFIIYNNSTGALSYDADGNGVVSPIQFALIGVNLALTNADFVVI